MADFEGLIRQALAKQDDGDEKIREKVYSSSRSALQRMLASRPGLTPESIEQRQHLLETSISKIETEYLAGSASSVKNQPAVENTVETPPVPEPVGLKPARPPQQNTGANVPQVQLEPDRPSEAPMGVDPPASTSTVQPNTAEVVSPDASVAREPLLGDAPEVISDFETQDYAEADLSEDFAASYRARRNTIRWLGIAGLLGVLALVVWVGYLLITSLAGGITVDPVRNSLNPVSPLNQVGGNDKSSQYITILEASDPSAIVTDGRGKASIVEEQSQSLLRLVSIRTGSDRTTPAEPMLLELKPGVLQQIAGKKVTVEVLAKSGSSGPATFAIECALGDYGSCGRKRFRVGLQPEAVVFSVDIAAGSGGSGPAYLAISTDIASSANLTGRGDVLDLVSARVRVLDGE